ncbi:hypothetical protein C8F04DRAFT_1078891 [Mycena alexandri]|uniref:Uncharacterized protein n=1 Tax=Mycena alexandri TaxID=1745969 RepID=A0AAD6T8L6_9AGAR|nr:hypothetical protein C8F04DRAFT_1078891 [Mycena alexandri]
MHSPYAQPPPGSPFVPGSPFSHQQQHAASPFASSVSASPVPAHTQASPVHPTYTSESGTSTEGSNIATRRTAAASSLMLPPLTHMYKRSLSAPCGLRRVAPPLPSPPIMGMGMLQQQPQSPVMSMSRMDGADAAMVMSPVMSAMGTSAGGGMGMERVQEGVGVGPAYPNVSGYFVPAPAPVQQRHQHGQQQQQGYTPGHGHTHVRRDTISFPVFGGAGGRGYQHPQLHPHPTHTPPTPHKRARGGAYTYPPPYAHTPLPMPAGATGGSMDAGPGPAPSYGGGAQAGWWWDRTRGGEVSDVYAESQGQERVGSGEDDGWADGGVAFGEYVPGPPSPSPPASLASPSASASPYTAHATAVPVPIPIRVADALVLGTSAPGMVPGRQRADPYAQPLPLSPLSDSESAAGDSRFRFPPRADSDLGGGSGRGGFRFAPPQAHGQGAPISSFSTLSGWAGDFAVSPTSTTSFAQGSSSSGTTQGNAIAGGSGAGTPPPQTSGWYQPPGWENSVQGSSSAGAPHLSTGMAAAQDDDAWADADPGYASLKASAAAWPQSPMMQEWSNARGDVEMYDWGARR